MGFFDEEPSIEEGVYAAKLDDVTLDETKDSPKLTLKYKLHTGQTAWQNFVFKDTTKKWISWQLGVIGAWQIAKENCQDADDFGAVARACLDAVGEHIGGYYDSEVTITEHNGKSYTNIKLNEEISAADAGKYKGATEAQAKAKASNGSGKVAEPPKLKTEEELPF